MKLFNTSRRKRSENLDLKDIYQEALNKFGKEQLQKMKSLGQALPLSYNK